MALLEALAEGDVQTAGERFLATLHEFMRVLRRFKWVMACVFALMVGLGVTRVMMATRLYTATTRASEELTIVAK